MFRFACLLVIIAILIGCGDEEEDNRDAIILGLEQEIEQLQTELDGYKVPRPERGEQPPPEDVVMTYPTATGTPPPPTTELPTKPFDNTLFDIPSDPPPPPTTRGKILFSSEGDIYVMGVDGSFETNLTFHVGDDESPVWSPDDKHIAFASHRHPDFNWEIYVMNADGTNQTNITNSHQTNERYPSWR